MSYIRITDQQYPITEREIRQLYPNISFPKPFVPPADYAWVFPHPQPACDPITERAQEIAPELTVLGTWEQRWEVVEIYDSPEDKAAAIAQAQEAFIAQTYKTLEKAVDDHVNAVAKAKGWDDRITVTLRSGYENPWQTEAIAYGQWMDACYLYCQSVQADVLADTRTIPTAQELIAELPEMVWPE